MWAKLSLIPDLQLRPLQQTILWHPFSVAWQCHFEKQLKFRQPEDHIWLCQTLTVPTKLGNQFRNKNETAKCFHWTSRSHWSNGKWERAQLLIFYPFPPLYLSYDWLSSWPSRLSLENRCTCEASKETPFWFSFLWCLLARANRLPRDLAYKNPNTFFLAGNIPHFLLYSKLWILEIFIYLAIYPV